MLGVAVLAVLELVLVAGVEVVAVVALVVVIVVMGVAVEDATLEDYNGEREVPGDRRSQHMGMRQISKGWRQQVMSVSSNVEK